MHLTLTTAIIRPLLRWLPLLIAMQQPLPAMADAFQIGLDDGNEINVEVLPAPGDLLMIWILDHEEERPQFEQMLAAIRASGVEIWRIDPLADFFLPRSNENARTLPGSSIAAVIDAAHRRSDKTILLASYDRMPLPLLRGVRQWQQRNIGSNRLAGSILYYPNLFGPPPLAGTPPRLDPIIAASNYPLVVVQPALGSQRWRLPQVMETLWQAGAAAHAQILPGVKDWFFMHKPGKNPLDDRTSQAIPAQIHALRQLLQASAKPVAVLETVEAAPLRAEIQELVPFNGSQAAVGLDLADIDGNRPFTGFQGKVTLVNFWATWCPPCVEEVPSLNRLQARYSGRPFSLISVDFREPAADIDKFRRKIQIEFPILMDQDGRASLAWDVFSFPSSFLIDAKGKLRYSINRAIDWDTPQVHALIDALLTEIERSD